MHPHHRNVCPHRRRCRRPQSAGQKSAARKRWKASCATSILRQSENLREQRRRPRHRARGLDQRGRLGQARASSWRGTRLEYHQGRSDERDDPTTLPPLPGGQGNAGITRHRGSWGGPAVREVASHQGRGQQARGGLLRHLCRHTTRPSHCPKASSGSCPGHDMQSAREARAATQGQKSRSWLTHRRRRAQRVMRRRTRGRRTAGVVRQKGDSCAVVHRASPWVSSWRPI